MPVPTVPIEIKNWDKFLEKLLRELKDVKAPPIIEGPKILIIEMTVLRLIGPNLSP